LPVGFAAANHLLAIGVQSIVYQRLCGDNLMIVLVAEVAEALGDGVQPCCLRLVPEGVVRVGAVNDLGQQNNRGIAVELYFFTRASNEHSLPW